MYNSNSGSGNYRSSSGYISSGRIVKDPTSGVKIRPSDSSASVKFTKAIQDIAETRNNTNELVEVLINDVQVKQSTNVLEALQSKTFLFHEAMEDLLKTPIQLEPGQINDYGIIINLEKLKTEGEKACQTDFDTQNSNNSMIRLTSGGILGCPTAFTHDDAEIQSFSAKPDCTSAQRSLFLEMKPEGKEIDALIQAVDRVVAQKTLCQYKSIHISLALTPSVLYAVSYRLEWCQGERGNKKGQVLKETLRILKMSPGDVNKVWALLTKEAIFAPLVQYVEGPDASMLKGLLGLFTRYFDFCRVTLMGASGSRTYGVTFPQWATGLYTVVSNKKKQFACKLIVKEEEFVREVCLLMVKWIYLLEHDLEGAKSFYAFGYYRYGDAEVTYFSDEGRQFGESIQTELKKWETHRKAVLEQSQIDSVADARIQARCYFHSKPIDDSEDISGGVILMYAGDPNGEKDEHGSYPLVMGLNQEVSLHVGNMMAVNNNVYTGVKEDLYRYHQAGINHRDIRAENVIYFPTRDCRFSFVYQQKDENFTVLQGEADPEGEPFPDMVSEQATQALKNSKLAVAGEWHLIDVGCGTLADSAVEMIKNVYSEATDVEQEPPSKRRKPLSAEVDSSTLSTQSADERDVTVALASASLQPSSVPVYSTGRVTRHNPDGAPVSSDRTVPVKNNKKTAGSTSSSSSSSNSSSSSSSRSDQVRSLKQKLYELTNGGDALKRLGLLEPQIIDKRYAIYRNAGTSMVDAGRRVEGNCFTYHSDPKDDDMMFERLMVQKLKYAWVWGN